MRKLNSGEIKISEIKHLENSRFRSQDDVSDLMEDMEQHGQLQSVGIRIEDKALIYGNRRVAAATKLNWENIKCDFFEGVTDEDLLVLNLIENIKRKSISGIEIGRICKILRTKGLKDTEIAKRLGLSVTRVVATITTYDQIVGTPYEKFVALGEHSNGIDVSTVQVIHTSIVMKGRKLSKADWNYLFSLILDNRLTQRKINTLAKIALERQDLSIDRCVDILNMSTVSEVTLTLDNIALRQYMVKEKCETPQELIKHIIRKFDDKLLF